ncbi:MAG: hypothetical protein JXB88_07455 [Spirochaetales bacterium]|nr:hypothetical protein [Spirochaetales bacterium]
MLRSKIFNRVTAFAGITGFTLLLINDVSVTFIPAISNIAMIFAMCGGILNAIWLVMLGWGFFLLQYKEAE